MAFAVEKLRKSYGGVPVLRGVDLDVRDGEIHALLGANGAGKSTLIKCICGAVAPDAGTITIDGTSHASLSPRTSREAGISVVQQELAVALSLTVADNIFLGAELRWGPFRRRRAQRAEARDWLGLLGANIEPDASPETLGNAELQMVTIVRALRSRPKVLILDEPTAALSEHEAEILGNQLLRLREAKLPILYVTHRLSEVFAIADRVSVLRGGEIVLTGKVRDLSRDRIVEAIVGDAVKRARAVDRDLSSAPEAMLVDGLLGPRIGPLTFDLKEGEILGVYGLVGSGRTELLETLFGATAREEGRVFLQDTDYRPRCPADAVAAGVALVPADRLRKSIIAGMSANDNLLLSRFRHLARFGLRSFSREQCDFKETGGQLGLRPMLPALEARRFSGGNQQKLVIGRWLSSLGRCRVLMLDEPTQGVDIGARADIYGALRRAAAGGQTSLIVTSSEPDELLQIADRVMVLAGGRIVGMLAGSEITESAMISLAHRIDAKEEVSA